MNLTHFEQHVLYHDAIDRREAKERAQRAELCSCMEIMGDNDNCPHHGLSAQVDFELAITEDLLAQECTCGPNPDAPACPSCRARHAHDELPF